MWQSYQTLNAPLLANKRFKTSQLLINRFKRLNFSCLSGKFLTNICCPLPEGLRFWDTEFGSMFCVVVQTRKEYMALWSVGNVFPGRQSLFIFAAKRMPRRNLVHSAFGPLGGNEWRREPREGSKQI